MGKIRDLNTNSAVSASALDQVTSAGQFVVDNAPDDSANPNETIKLNQSQFRTVVSKFDTSLPDNLTVSNPLGNLTTSTTVGELKTKTASQILIDILLETLDPTRTNKSLSLSRGGTSQLEVGTTINGNVVLTATFNQGLITNGGNVLFGGISSQALVGAASQYNFTGPALTGTVSQASNIINGTFSDGSAQISAGTNTWNVTVDHAAGDDSIAYVNSLLEPQDDFDGERGAGTGVLSTNASVTGRYRIFHDSIGGGSQSGANSEIDAFTSATRRLPNSQFETSNSFRFQMAASDFGFVFYARTASGLTPTATGAVPKPVEDLNTGADLTPLLVSRSVDVNDAGGNPVTYTEYRFTSASNLVGDIQVTLT